MWRRIAHSKLHRPCRTAAHAGSTQEITWNIRRAYSPTPGTNTIAITRQDPWLRNLGFHPPNCQCCNISRERKFELSAGNLSQPVLQKQPFSTNETGGKDESSEKSTEESPPTENSSTTHDSSLSSDNEAQSDLAPPGIPGSQKGGRKLAIVFTCTVCNTRAAKQFTEQAYRHGVVLVRCPGCGNHHLIADNLSMFTDSDEEGWNVEKAMAKLNQKVTTVTNDNVFELTLDEVVGMEHMKEIFESNKESSEGNNKGGDEHQT